MTTREWLLYFAWVVALVGVCLSIFLGEISLNTPCPFCWYQRIFLFPLVILLGIAAYRNDWHIVPYAVPFAILGVLAAFLHILDGTISLLHKTAVCHLGDVCTKSLDVPILSAIGFILIAVLLLVGSIHFSHRKKK